jgi:hypothetical protein
LQSTFTLKCPSIGYVRGKKPYVFVVCDPWMSDVMAATPRGKVHVRCGESPYPDGAQAVMLHEMFVDVESPRGVPVLLVFCANPDYEPTPERGLWTEDGRDIPVKLDFTSGAHRYKAWIPGGVSRLGWQWGT